MAIRYKTVGIWVVVIALSVVAFQAGEQFRDFHGSPSAKAMASMQASALLKLTPESAPVTVDTTKQGKNQQRELVNTILVLLKAHYVDPITKDKETEMARGAVRGMMESLDDPDSRFLDPSERDLLEDAGAGKFHGIGAIFALKKDKVGDLDVTKLVVITPMPGSPADKAGMKPGDSITYVDDKWIIAHDPFKEAHLEKLAQSVRSKETDGLTYQKAYDAAFKKLKDGVSLFDALETITAKKTGEISLRVERAGESKPMDLKLKCRDTTVAPVMSQPLNHGVAYIRVTQFSRTAPQQFANLLREAQARHAKALVLDLRNNPGGLIESAAVIAGKINGGGVIASIQTNTDRKTIREPRGRKLGIPVVVLINEGTASVAEMVAGTLKETGSATLIGAKTFGDGLVQTPLMLKDGSVAILTTGKMLTVKGTDFSGKGLSPDKAVREGSSSNDTQRDEAVKVLLAKIGKA